MRRLRAVWGPHLPQRARSLPGHRHVARCRGRFTRLSCPVKIRPPPVTRWASGHSCQGRTLLATRALSRFRLPRAGFSCAGRVTATRDAETPATEVLRRERMLSKGSALPWRAISHAPTGDMHGTPTPVPVVVALGAFLNSGSFGGTTDSSRPGAENHETPCGVATYACSPPRRACSGGGIDSATARQPRRLSRHSRQAPPGALIKDVNQVSPCPLIGRRRIA